MTRYSKSHKAEVREQIIREAARLFRRHGYSGVGIDRIMAAAGLTRGGFYNHFKSKSELLAAVLAADHEFIERMQARDPAQLGPEGVAVAQGYLSPENRANVATGCSIAALAMEAARGAHAEKQAYGSAVATLLEEFERGIEDAHADDPRAAEALAMCIGGLLLSAAVDDKATRTRHNRVLADHIAQSCKDAVQRILTDAND